MPEINVFDDYYMELFDGSSSVDFGSTPVGSPVQRTFTIENWGTGDLTLDPNSLNLPAGYSVVSSFDQTVAPYYSTSFTIQLDGATAGSYSGTLSFTNNDSDENPFDFTISGQVAAEPEIGVYDDQSSEVYDGYTTVYFDSTTVGVPVVETFTIENTGTGDLTLDTASLTVPTGFSVVSVFAGTVAPGQSTSFSIQLDASSQGYYGGPVSFSNNDSDENPFEFYVNGDVNSTQPEISVRLDGAEVYDNFGTVDFGSTAVGSPVQRTFTIENWGTGDLTLDPNSLNLPAGYSVVSSFDQTVAPYYSTSFTIQLDGATAGSYSGTLSFTNNDSDENPFDFTISGQVVAEPEIGVYDDQSSEVYDGYTTVYFDSTSVGVPVVETFTIENTGTGNLTLDTASLTVPTGFSVVSMFADTVAPGQSTSLSIQLDASSQGYYSGPVAFSNNDSDENPFEFYVNGDVNSTQPEISVTLDGAEVYDNYSMVDFGSTTVGSAVQKTFTIENWGTGDLTLDPNSLNLPTGYSVVSSFDQTVAPYYSTSFTIQLDGTTAGSYSGTLSFTNNDSEENPFDFTITGHVDDPSAPEIEVVDASSALIADGSGNVDFGSTAEGTAVDKTFTVNNLGTADLTLDSASLSVPSGFSVVTSPAETVAPGASTTFTVRLDGTPVGTYSGTLSLTNNDTDENPYDFTVSGEVFTAVPEIEVVDAAQAVIGDGTGSVDFGSTPEGTPVTETFTIRNTGTTDLTLDSGSLSVPSGFTVVTTLAETVAPGASTTLVVRLDAATEGTYGGTLSFANNDADENPYDFTISGDVYVPAPEIQVIDALSMGIADGTGTFDFGTTCEGTPVEQTFTIKNVGTANLTLDGASLTVPTGFSVVTTFAATVAPDSSTTLTIQLDAAMEGTYNGTLSFASNDANENPFDFTVTGEVTTPVPEIEVVDASSTLIADGTGSVDFGGTPAGTPIDQTFTVENVGTGDLTLDPASLSVPTGFSVVSAFAASVAPGASASFTVRLDAAAVGSYSGTVSFTNNDSDENPYDFAVNGEVTSAPEPEIQVLDASSAAVADGTGSVDFGSTLVDSAVEQTFTIENLGSADLSLDSASLSVPTGFSVVTTFAETVAAGGSTTFTVKLDATTAGTYSGTLSFTTDDGDENPFDFTITGEVLLPEPEIEVTTTSADSPEDVPDGTGSVDFGTTPIGTPVRFDLWIENTGEGHLTLNRDSLLLPDGFSVYSWFSETLVPGGRTLFIVQLDAEASGTYSGQLSFATTDADENPYDFTVTGEVLAATGPVTIDPFGLFNDTGTSDTDKVTFNPVLTGVVNGDFGGGYVQVEFDHDADHQSIAGFMEVPRTASTFLYDPREDDLSLADYTGPLSIYYRFVQYDAGDNVVATGDWTEFGYTLETPPAGSGAYVENLRLVNDTGDWTEDGITSDPTVTCYTGMGVTVVFEVDGVPQGQAGTKSDENTITYYPLGLAYGVPSTIRARGKQWDYDHGMYLYGSWSDSITITVRQDPPPEITELKLQTDTGEDATDKVTSEATLIGLVDLPDGCVTSFQIEFDHDGDGAADGDTWSDDAGRFLYEPTGLADGTPTTIRARVSRWDSLVDEYLYSPWESLTFTYEAVPPAGVSVLKLRFPVSDQPDVTEDPTLRGELTGESGVASVVVQFDHDGDGAADGSTISDEYGRFSYYVTGLTPGPDPITVRARTSQWDENLADYAHSDWTPLSFTLQAPANDPVVIDELVLLNDTGDDDSDGVTTDPTLTGLVSNDGSCAYLEVEFQEGGNVLGYALTDGEGRFTFSPSDLTPGELTVQARAREWDYVAGDFLYSDWGSLPFTLEAVIVPAPVIAELDLLCDTGASQTDGYTANPTLVGAVTDDGDAVAALAIEVDHDGTDGVDEVHGVTFTNSEGTFHYLPAALSFGQQTVQARAKRWDGDGQQWIVGNWTQLTFHYEDQTNAAPMLVELGLANDTGTDDTDGITSDPTLAGRVINEDVLEGVTIEFDYDGDQAVDQSTAAGRWGDFTLTPEGLAYGPVTIYARTREFDDVAGDFLYSGWTSFAFTYEEPVNAAAEVTELELVNDLDETGTDPRASDPTLTGLVTNDGPVEALLVQFDHDGDGVIEGTALADSDGHFTYVPVGLELGTVTISARAKEYDEQSSVLYGAWFPLQFTLEEPAATTVEVTQLELAEGYNGATANPTVTGQVGGPGSLEGITIQFDHDGDGETDGTTSTYYYGYFSYTPEGLEEGRVTIRARTVKDDGDSPEYGSWVSTSFVYSSDPEGQEAQDLAAAYADFDADWQAAQDNYDTATAAADLAYRTQLDAALAGYDAAMAAAGATQASTVEGARATYTSEVAAAEAAYAIAMDAAAAAFATAMGDFTAAGYDGTAYYMEDFVWPEAPDANALEIPYSGEMPPIGVPSYGGSPYNFQADPAYRDAVAAAYATYSQAVQDAAADYSSDYSMAESTYSSALTSAGTSGYSSADAAYSDAFTGATSSTPAADLSAAWMTYNRLCEAAYATYHSSVQSAEDAYSAVEAAARATRDAEIAAALQRYNDAVNNGADASGDVCLTYQTEVAQAQETYDQDVLPEQQKRDEKIAAAVCTRDKALNAASAALQQAQITYRCGFDRQQAIQARDAAVDAATDGEASALAVAQAEKDKADAVAQADRDRSVALAEAEKELWIDLAEAKQASIDSLINVRSTPWSEYLGEQVANALDYVTGAGASYVTYATALADALYGETLLINAALKNQADTVASASSSRAATMAMAAGDLVIDQIDASETAQKAYATNTADAADEYAEAVEAYDKAIAAAEAALTQAGNDASRTHWLAWLAAEVEYHNAMVAYGEDPYGGGIDPDAAAQTRDEAQYDAYCGEACDLAQAWCAHTLAYITAEGNRDHKFHKADKDLAQNNNAAEKTRADAVAAAVEDCDDDVAGAEGTFYTSTAQAAISVEDVVADAVGNLSLALTQAEITLQSDLSGFARDLAIADAQSEKTFLIAAATEYATAVANWDSTQNTPWSGYLNDLAQAEKDRVTALGTAGVSFATGIGGADCGWTFAVTASVGTFAIGEHAAWQFRTSSITGARNTYAGQMGTAWTDYGEDVADAVCAQSMDVASAYKTHGDTVAGAGETYANATGDADRAYRTVVAQANRDQTWFECERLTTDPNAAGRIATAAADKTTAEADARFNNTVAIAAAARDQTTAVNAAAVGYAGGLAGADDTFASGINTYGVALASAVSGAETFYVNTVTGDAEICAIGVAAADKASTNQIASAVAGLNTGLTDAANDYREAAALALGDYEVTMYTNHKSDMQSEYTADSTELNDYRLDVAGADLAWAQGVRLQRNAYHLDLTAGYDGYASDLNAASTGYASDLGLADEQYGTSMGAADKGWVRSTTAALCDWDVAMTTADLEHFESSVNAQGEHAVDLAEADRDHGNAIAVALFDFEWDKAYAQKYVDLGTYTQTDYNTAVAAASADYDTAAEAAGLVQVTAQGQAEVTLAENLGDAGIVYATAVGDAEVDFTGDMNAADSTYASQFAAAENAWVGLMSSAETTYATNLAQADKDLIEDVGIADVAYVTALGSLDVTNIERVSEDEADYHLAVANQKAAEASAWATSEGTPEAEYAAAYAQAQADWIGGLGSNYVNFARRYAQAQADYDVAMTGHLTNVAADYAGHFVTFAGAAAGEAGTHWASSTSEILTYEQDRITRENTLLAQYSGSGRTYGISAATAGRQQAVDVATAEKNLSIGQYQGSPTAQDDYDTAIAAAAADYGLGLAGANLTWTTDVVGAETTFLCEEATGRKELVTGVAGLSPGVAGLDKAYKVNLAGHASTADNDDAADLAQFWNDAESAKSDRYYDQCWAWADFRYDSYAEQASAVATLATTIDIPWAHFQADLYAAKRDWWNTTMSDYLTWVSDTNQEYEDYQAAVGTEYVDLVADTTAADVAYMTEMANAEETRQVAKAVAGETYVHAIAGARETYLVGMSQASRDLAAGGDQSTYDSTVSSAADTYRTDAAGASGDRRVDLAQADKDYADAIYGETGAALTWKSGRAAALKTFTISESTARADRDTALATLRRDYLTLEAQSYAAALDTLAATSGTPWATLLAAEAAAEAARIAEILSEEALLEIATATAARDSQIAAATATATLTTAESSAQAARQVATAAAACNRATAQANTETSNPEAAVELPEIEHCEPVGEPGWLAWLFGVDEYELGSITEKIAWAVGWHPEHRLAFGPEELFRNLGVDPTQELGFSATAGKVPKSRVAVYYVDARNNEHVFIGYYYPGQGTLVERVCEGDNPALGHGRLLSLEQLRQEMAKRDSKEWDEWFRKHGTRRIDRRGSRHKRVEEGNLPENIYDRDYLAEKDIEDQLRTAGDFYVTAPLLVVAVGRGSPIRSYSQLQKVTQGQKAEIQAHKILEARHMRAWGYAAEEIGAAPAQILSRAEHVALNIELQIALPRGRVYSRREVWSAYQRVYRHYPEYLKAIKSYFK